LAKKIESKRRLIYSATAGKVEKAIKRISVLVNYFALFHLIYVEKFLGLYLCFAFIYFNRNADLEGCI